MRIQDIVFLATIAACTTAASFLTVPLVTAIPIPGIRTLSVAFFDGLFLAIGAMKVGRLGSVFLPGFLHGLVLTPITWVLPVLCSVSGLAAEAVVWLVFGGYRREAAIILGAGLYAPVGIPISLSIAALVGGPAIRQFAANPWVVIPVMAGTAVLSFGGAWAGLKAGRELRKAGKLRPAE